MIEAMNDNQTNILKFPYQIMDWDADLTDEQLTYQARLNITNLLNKVVAGEKVLTPEAITIIENYNATVTPFGYTKIEYEHLLED